MSQDLYTLINNHAVFIFAGSIAICGIVAGCIKSVVASVTRERTRREIAAYIAEKSMTPEEGERLMAAGRRKDSCC